MNTQSTELIKSRPRRAIILAAGLGMRMIPINTQLTKGMLEIQGERLIERLIGQLNTVGIYEIYIVVGFMKEQYEYLIDKYQVELIVNAEYAEKNNLYSLSLVIGKLDYTYIVPCDIWCAQNPFSENEPYSWYMVTEKKCPRSNVRVTKKEKLIRCAGQAIGNQMTGIAYLRDAEAQYLAQQIKKMVSSPKHENDFWEEALWREGYFAVAARCVSADMVYEINTYEQLRELDSGSKSLNSKIIQTVADILHVPCDEITGITALKKGMTNRSFCCTCNGKRYIMRIPGEGTDKLIDRQAEYSAYQAVKDLNICDRICYMNPDNGYKLSEFVENTHVCDSDNKDEIKKCMKFLREFHAKKITVKHSFNLWEHIEYYETLWNRVPSVYQDYLLTKKHVYELKEFIECQKHDWTLTHIDAVPDNFLICENGEIMLIDWEYAGMQDPHVDIAMFAVYALYDREQVDFLINAYFPEGTDKNTRLKIYCYIAVCGLLWSNWCEYKSLQGVEFGEYNLRQYRYAKEYYKIFQEERNA